MKFTKLHGYGNDYIIIEAAELARVESISAFVKRICDRHRGAGADGVGVIGESEQANFSLRIFNPDGSEAAMSGNGSRCAAAYLYHHDLWRERELKFETRAGIKRFTRRDDSGQVGVYKFTAEIGRPVFTSAQIPMLTDEPLKIVCNYDLKIDNSNINITALQMCNPNVCVFVKNFDELDWQCIGRLIETHRAFPERTNVEFVRVRNRQNIEVRVWERGVGVTESSGTGACAAAVASMINNLTDRRINVEMPGGIVEVEWRETDDEVTLTGTAHVIYEASYCHEL